MRGRLLRCPNWLPFARAFRAVLEHPRIDDAAALNAYILAPLIKAHRLRLLGRLVHNGPGRLMRPLGLLRQEAKESR
eukprot:6767447-Pyramimonas_sp.AAC.1